MTESTKDLLERALALTPEERAELAVELIASVDGAKDGDVEAAWAAEIERRVAAARTGTSVARSWDEVESRIRRDVLG